MPQEITELNKQDLLNRISQLENQLQEERASNNLKNVQFEKIFNTVSDLICLHEPDGTYKKVSPSVLDLTGYKPSDLIGRTPNEFIHPEDQNKVAYDAHSKLLVNKSEYQGVEYRFKHKNGKYIWLTTSTDIITNEQGNLKELVTYSVETTSRKKLLDEVRQLNQDLSDRVEAHTKELRLINNELEQQFNALNQAAKVSIADADGNIIFINEKFQKTTGYTQDELIGKNHRVLKSGVHDKTFYKEMWSKLLKGETWSGEICNRKKDGTLYWVYTQIHPFTNVNGEIEKYVSLRFNITEFKEQEKKIKLNASILEKVNDKLSAANAELETFTYSVTHDLKAPLRAMKGFSDNLLKSYRGSLDERGENWLQFIAENADKMDTLINDLLAYIKLGKNRLDLVSVDLNNLIKGVSNRLVGNYNQVVEFNIKDLPNSFVDYNVMEVVWQNLIDNALKYSSHKEKIEIKVWAEENNKEHIIKISDNGVGFEEDESAKIFGIFKRLQSAENFDGTGIGLANVKRGIELHGGSITAKGKPNEGATFTVKIPKKIA